MDHILQLQRNEGGTSYDLFIVFSYFFITVPLEMVALTNISCTKIYLNFYANWLAVKHRKGWSKL